MLMLLLVLFFSVFDFTVVTLIYSYACSGFILNVYLFIASDIGNYTLILHWCRFIWHPNICRREDHRCCCYFIFCLFLFCRKGQWNKQNEMKTKKKSIRLIFQLLLLCDTRTYILALINVYDVSFDWVSFSFSQTKIIQKSPFNICVVGIFFF